jgi:hypothetical protein
MRPRPSPHQPLSQCLPATREIARKAAERAVGICATATETRIRAEHLVAESKAAREARRSSRLGHWPPFSTLR